MSEEVKAKALEQVKSLDTQKVRMVEESESRAQLRQVELEKELEDKTREYEDTIKEM